MNARWKYLEVFKYGIVILCIYCCSCSSNSTDTKKPVADSSVRDDSEGIKSPIIKHSSSDSNLISPLVLFYDWNKDGIPDTFIILNAVKDTNGSPKVIIADSLIIKLSNHRTFIFDIDSLGGFIDYFNEYPNAFVSKNNLLKNNIIALLDVGLKYPVLFIATHPYASDPGKLYLLSLDGKGNPHVFFHNPFAITAFKDLDGDGIKEVIGYTDFAQCEGGVNDDGELTGCSYHPFNIIKFKQLSNGIHIAIDTVLSKQYTKAHYGPWRGIDGSEKYVTYRPDSNHKWQIMREDSFQMLMHQKN